MTFLRHSSACVCCGSTQILAATSGRSATTALRVAWNTCRPGTRVVSRNNNSGRKWSLWMLQSMKFRTVRLKLTFFHLSDVNKPPSHGYIKDVYISNLPLEALVALLLGCCCSSACSSSPDEDEDDEYDADDVGNGDPAASSNMRLLLEEELSKFVVEWGDCWRCWYWPSEDDATEVMKSWNMGVSMNWPRSERELPASIVTTWGARNGVSKVTKVPPRLSLSESDAQDVWERVTGKGDGKHWSGRSSTCSSMTQGFLDHATV